MKYRIRKRRVSKNAKKADIAATIVLVLAAIVAVSLGQAVVTSSFGLAALVAIARLLRH